MAATLSGLFIDGSYTLMYTTQYYLTVTSSLGTTDGSGWYDAGSLATFSVSPTRVRTADVTGALGAAYLFDHWSGDSSSTDATSSLTMNSPAKVDAVWRHDYQTFYQTMIVVITTNIIIIVVVVVWRRKRLPHEAAAQPGPMRICPSCGYELSRFPDDIRKCPYCAHDLP